MGDPLFPLRAFILPQVFLIIDQRNINDPYPAWSSERLHIAVIPIQFLPWAYRSSSLTTERVQGASSAAEETASR